MSAFDDFFQTWNRINETNNLSRKLKAMGSFINSDLINRNLLAKSYASSGIMSDAIMGYDARRLSQFTATNELLKKISLRQQNIPKPFDSDLYKAVSLQETFFLNIANLNKSYLSSKALQQANVLCRAASNLSTSIFTETLRLKKWNSLSNLSPYYERITEITEGIENEHEVTNKTLIDFETLQNEVRLQAEILLKDKKSFVKSFLALLGIIGFLISLYSLYLQKTDISNIEEAKIINQNGQEVKQEILKYLDSLFNNNRKVVLITNCPIKVKPINNSGIIGSIKIGESASVLDSCKKYYLIAYQREVGDYLITGWILKKHVKYE